MKCNNYIIKLHVDFLKLHLCFKSLLKGQCHDTQWFFALFFGVVATQSIVSWCLIFQCNEITAGLEFYVTFYSQAFLFAQVSTCSCIEPLAQIDTFVAVFCLNCVIVICTGIMMED